mmetsp:Transcript_66833/g.145768  ORF Transcript_66833/g.145768 Transcript_66833/m.145768 type:complete len:225 (+) Transcript_66833:34-708(+)
MDANGPSCIIGPHGTPVFKSRKPDGSKTATPLHSRSPSCILACLSRLWSLPLCAKKQPAPQRQTPTKKRGMAIRGLIIIHIAAATKKKLETAHMQEIRQMSDWTTPTIISVIISTIQPTPGMQAVMLSNMEAAISTIVVMGQRIMQRPSQVHRKPMRRYSHVVVEFSDFMVAKSSSLVGPSLQPVPPRKRSNSNFFGQIRLRGCWLLQRKPSGGCQPSSLIMPG